MTIDEVVERLIALKWIAKKNGMKTDRSQQAILRALGPQELAEVAVRLKQFEEPDALHGVKEGVK